MATNAKKTGEDSGPQSDAAQASRLSDASGSATGGDVISPVAEGIGPDVARPGQGETAAGPRDRGPAMEKKRHPSRFLPTRSSGYGIGGGYEKPYSLASSKENRSESAQYGPLPHSGYYGAGSARLPFGIGQAGFGRELEWYRKQYGEKTSRAEGDAGDKKV